MLLMCTCNLWTQYKCCSSLFDKDEKCAFAIFTGFICRWLQRARFEMEQRAVRILWDTSFTLITTRGAYKNPSDSCMLSYRIQFWIPICHDEYSSSVRSLINILFGKRIQFWVCLFESRKNSVFAILFIRWHIIITTKKWHNITHLIIMPPV